MEFYQNSYHVVNITLYYSVTLVTSGPNRTAKPLFIGSIPIAASNRINSLERSSSAALSFCTRNVRESVFPSVATHDVADCLYISISDPQVYSGITRVSTLC